MKKLLAFFLTIAMLLCFSVVAFADATEITTVGYSSKRVEKVDLTDVPDILDYADYVTSPEAYKITNAQGLADLASWTNLGDPFTGVTIYLANDIDMTGVEDFKPIGNGRAAAYFRGNFDGQGHVIDNLKVSMTEEDIKDNIVFCGLFGTVVKGSIKNLVIGSGCEFQTTTGDLDVRTGAVVANVGASVVIDNVYNLGTVSGQRNTGGIVGFLDGFEGTDERTISNCTNAGTISTVHGPTGGIVGMVAQPTLTISNCRNVGAINGKGGTGETDTFNAVGGIAGRCFADGLTITGCINNGTITSQNAMAGGILGGMQTKNTAEITDCVNYGELSGLVTGLYNAAKDITVTVTNSENKPGETDSSLENDLEEIVPNFPSEEQPGGDEDDDDDPDPNVTTNPDDTDDKTPAQTDNTDDSTSGSNTTTESPTSENTQEPSGSEKSGCASTVSGILVIVLMSAGATLAVSRRKEN